MKPNKQNTMEAIYLQSSSQFGETLKSVSDSDYRRLRDNYDALLKQPLKLGFFVPCDYGNGFPIAYTKDTLLNSMELLNGFEEAKERVLFKGLKQHLKLGFFVPCDSIRRLVESIGAEEWDNAKKNVLFKGFEHYLFRQANNVKHNKSRKCFSFPNYNGVIIEDLISLEVELTESAIKQIGQINLNKKYYVNRKYKR